MSKLAGRALHYVFKIGDRNATSHFYRDILGMKVLRHEEFADGCEATCNGPYANRWSKTMVGYGSEDTHFVVELTYNYPVKQYDLGNDFIGITIKSREALERAKQHDYPIHEGNVLKAPDGYRFFILDEPQPTDQDPVQKVTLASTNLERSIAYWHKLLGLDIYHQEKNKVTVGFAPEQAKLELQLIDEPLNRAQAYGRIAFTIPYNQQEDVDARVKAANETVLNSLISLDTPGKATVRVVILADPDGHEICFVDDENYRKLSVFDPEGEKLLDRYMKKDLRDRQ